MKPKCEEVNRKSGKKTHVPKLDLSTLSQPVISEQSHSNRDESKKKVGHEKDAVQQSELIPQENLTTTERPFSNRDENPKRKGHGLFHSSVSNLSPPWSSKSRLRSISANSLSPKKHESDDIELNEPQLPSGREYSSPLNISTIIKMDDPFYGETLAYNAPKFINQRDTSPLRKRHDTLTVHEYIELKTLEINTIQAEKIKLLQQIINLLNPDYYKQKRTCTEHDDLNKEIRQIVVLSMCTTLDSFNNKVELLNMTSFCTQDKFGDFFEKFWTGFMCGYLPRTSMSQEEFKLHLNNMLSLYDKAFELVEQLRLFQVKHLPHVTDYGTTYFLTMNCFSSLCQANLKEETYDLFFQAYKQKNMSTEYICILDILFYIYEKKKEANADLKLLDLIEVLLKHEYTSPYNHFLMELNDNKLSVKEEKLSKVKFSRTS